MAIADIRYEILDKCAPPQIRQQILGIVLCLEIPLFPFTMLVTELTHTLLYPQKILCLAQDLSHQDNNQNNTFTQKWLDQNWVILPKTGLTENG